jgi:hypothetical protein
MRSAPVKGWLKLWFDDRGSVVKGDMHGTAAMKFFDKLLVTPDAEPVATTTEKEGTDE